MSEYMSGDELYRFLHISKRKMKYLLENGYIPVVDTGKKTHRYLVRKDDAESFLAKMETPGFLYELSGMFSSRATGETLKAVTPFEPSESNCEKLKRHLTVKWSDLPDALTSRTAADLIGIAPGKVNSLIRTKTLVGANVCGVWHCTKESLIEYASSVESACALEGEAYKTILREVQKHTQ